MVQDNHVSQAITHKIYCLSLVEECIQEMIVDGSLLLNVTGKPAG